MSATGDFMRLAGRRLKARAREQWRATREAFQQGLRGVPAPSEIDAHYALLELPPGADLDAVEEAWRRLLRLYHPDRFARDPVRFQRATEVTKALNQARAELRRHLAATTTRGSSRR